MRLSTRLQLALLAWIVLEVVVFSWVAHVIGGAGALLLTLLGSFFGWTLMKRAGASALVKLRSLIEGRAGVPNHRQFFDETLTTIGALGLLVPGFLSDLVGIVLAIPSARRVVARMLGRGSPDRSMQRSSMIDLDPTDWQRRDPSDSPLINRDKT